MRVFRRVIAVAVAVGLVTLAAQPLVATMPTIPQYFDYTLEPKSLPDKSGPVELLLTFKMKPEYECDSVLVQVGVWKQLVYNGPAEFWASLAETGEYSTTLSVIVPPNDTSALKIWLMCQGGRVQGLRRVFITTGDTITVLDYLPTSIPEPVRRSADRYLVRSGSWRETFSVRHRLTEEQLQAKRTVAIGLSNPDDHAFAESLLGPIPDSALIPGTRNAYLLDMTLDHLLRMTERGIRVDEWPEQTELVFPQDIQKPDETPPNRENAIRVTPKKSRTEQYWEDCGLSKEMLEDRSGLTEEQLRTKHTVVIGLSDAEHYEFAESLLGPIPDSAAVPGIKGAFIFEITLDHLLRMAERGIKFDPTPEYRERLLKKRIEEPVEVPSDEKSAIPMSPVGLSLDHVDG